MPAVGMRQPFPDNRLVALRVVVLLRLFHNHLAQLFRTVETVRRGPCLNVAADLRGSVILRPGPVVAILFRGISRILHFAALVDDKRAF